MPVLTAEPDCYPADLLEGGSGGTEDHCWSVFHTKPRQEKALARELYRLQVPFYLPLAASKKRYQGRWLTSHLPLFTGYLFLFADPAQRLAALGTRRVVNTLPVHDQLRLAQDLAQVRRLLASGAPVIPEDRLVPGARVVLCSGPLEGMRGKIVETRTGRRFVIEVDFIHKGASIEVDASTHLELLP